MIKVFKKIEIKINQNVISIQDESSMFQPTAFKDRENIIVVDYVPYYRYTGSSYRDKLKNGLSLDYVFYQQDLVPIMNEEIVEEVVSNEPREILEFADYEENYEFYEQKKFQVEGIIRKGKWIPFKKRQSRNVKKNKNKLHGYVDKLFAIEQNLPNLFDESQIEIDYEDASYISYDDYYNDYYDNLSYC